MRTNSDCTIYNKYIHPTNRNELFQRTQIRGVAWENRKASNVLRTGGNISADQARIFIPFVHGDNYLEPVQWLALEDKTGFWTLQVGDIIAKGLIATNISGATQLTEIKKANNNVLVISSVDTMDGGSPVMWHWQVGAK